MVLDSVKGIEPQTLKLFEVCRTRGLPILTFINKLDQEGRAPVISVPLHDPRLVTELGDEAAAALRDDVALLDTASPAFDRDAFLNEKATPVCFGSALNNFGVEPFLAALIELARRARRDPASRRSRRRPARRHPRRRGRIAI